MMQNPNTLKCQTTRPTFCNTKSHETGYKCLEMMFPIKLCNMQKALRTQFPLHLMNKCWNRIISVSPVLICFGIFVLPQEYTGEDDSDLYLDERETALRQAQEEKRRIQMSVPGILNPHEMPEEMQD